jgi:hypothetical protein
MHQLAGLEAVHLPGDGPGLRLDSAVNQMAGSSEFPAVSFMGE